MPPTGEGPSNLGNGRFVAPSRPPYVLAIDLGTSACKVALATGSGEILALEQEPVPLILLPDGGAEQDPGAWWAAIVRATRRLLDRGVVPPGGVAAVGCTSQWSGTVAVDRAGESIGNAIIWMDSRGAPYVRAVTGGLPRVEGYGLRKLVTWIRLTGGIPGRAGKDSIAHILFLKHERPQVYRAAHKFLEPKDYLNLRLTGRFAATFDSATLTWVTDTRRPDRIRYDDRLLRWVGVERSKLPDLVRAVDVVGLLQPGAARELGLQPGIPVVGGTPDIQAATLGSGAAGDFEGHLYVGTSSWITCHVPYKKTDLLHNMASLPAAIPGRYFVADEQQTAGACLAFIRDQGLLGSVGPEMGSEAYAAFDRMAARAAPGSGGLIFTPWLYGERTPVEDRYVRGGFFNLSLATTREEMVRSVLEGVAFNARWLLGHLERFVGRRLDSLNLIGGGAVSEVWCQIYADVLGRTVRQVRNPVQATVRGAAILAGVALGSTTFQEASARVPIARVFEPDPATRSLYDGLFREFLAIYRKNRSIHAALNRQVAVAAMAPAGRSGVRVGSE